MPDKGAFASALVSDDVNFGKFQTSVFDTKVAEVIDTLSHRLDLVGRVRYCSLSQLSAASIGGSIYQHRRSRC